MKRANLLEAGLGEFSKRGLSGTGVEEIAAAAGCSSGLIYSYFGSKEGLFDAVLEHLVSAAVEEVPFTADDLPGYAGRLFDANVKRPEVLRFVGWYQLERSATSTSKPPADEATRKKVQLVRAAQREGRIDPSLDPGELVLAVQAIALMWFSSPAAVGDAVIPSKATKRRRAAVVDAVQRLLGS